PICALRARGLDAEDAAQRSAVEGVEEDDVFVDRVAARGRDVARPSYEHLRRALARHVARRDLADVGGGREHLEREEAVPVPAADRRARHHEVAPAASASTGRRGAIVAVAVLAVPGCAVSWTFVKSAPSNRNVCDFTVPQG